MPPPHILPEAEEIERWCQSSTRNAAAIPMCPSLRSAAVKEAAGQAVAFYDGFIDFAHLALQVEMATTDENRSEAAAASACRAQAGGHPPSTGRRVLGSP